MVSEVIRTYTLEQRRIRDALNDCRDLDSIKAWLDENVVGPPVKTSDFRESTLDQKKDELRARAIQKHKRTLELGFDDGNGAVWPATGGPRDRILDLTQRIQEFRAGNMASALPNGKSTVKLRDVNNQPHDADPDKIVALAEQGSDFVDQVEDRLEELIASIEAATSHSDLDNVNVMAGWP